MQTDNIVAIRGATVETSMGQPDPKIVECLSLALEQAKRGEIVAVGVIKVRGNDHVGFAWECPANGGHLMIAGCNYLLHDLLADTARVVEGGGS